MKLSLIVLSFFLVCRAGFAQSLYFEQSPIPHSIFPVVVYPMKEKAKVTLLIKDDAGNLLSTATGFPYKMMGTPDPTGLFIEKNLDSYVVLVVISPLWAGKTLHLVTLVTQSTGGVELDGDVSVWDGKSAPSVGGDVPPPPEDSEPDPNGAPPVEEPQEQAGDPLAKSVSLSMSRLPMFYASDVHESDGLEPQVGEPDLWDTPEYDELVTPIDPFLMKKYLSPLDLSYIMSHFRSGFLREIVLDDGVLTPPVLFSDSQSNKSVVAAAKGKIVAHLTMTGQTPLIVIEHLPGVYTIYGAFRARALYVGQIVKAGEVLGHLDAGRPLLFRLQVGTQSADEKLYFDSPLIDKVSLAAMIKEDLSPDKGGANDTSAKGGE